MDQQEKEAREDPRTQAFFDEGPPTIAEQASALRLLKEQRDEAQAAYKSLDAQFKADQEALMQRFEDEDVNGIKQGGVNFVPTTTIYGQIQDRSEFVEWAKEQDDELIEYRERPELINELARTLLDNGEPFPPGLSFRTKKFISQRVAK